MHKWITRTFGTVLIGAAFSVAGTGIAAADSVGADRGLSMWDSILTQAVGPTGNLCDDIAEHASRSNTAMCGPLTRDDEDTRPAPANRMAPGRTTNAQAQQRSAPRPANPAPAKDSGLLGNNRLPILRQLQGLGLG